MSHDVTPHTRHLERFYVGNDNAGIDKEQCIETEGAHEHDFVQIVAAIDIEKGMDKKRIMRCSTCDSVFCETCGKLIKETQREMIMLKTKN